MTAPESPTKLQRHLLAAQTRNECVCDLHHDPSCRWVGHALYPCMGDSAYVWHVLLRDRSEPVVITDGWQAYQLLRSDPRALSCQAVPLAAR